MKKRSEPPETWDAAREKIIGLGERSLRKTYYPELQEKLEELERFRALLDQSNDCIFLLALPSLTFIDVNESACRQLGCSRQQFLTLPMEKLFPEEAMDKVKALIATGPADGKDQVTIITRLNKCVGGGIPVEILIRLVTFNRRLYGVAVARDITERQQAEQALLENSRILRDMELARQIQLSLLPTAPPQLPGIRLEGCCVPAAHVGGDYYDYFTREGTFVDLVVVDVSGHSIGAALMAAEARSVLRAQVYTFGGTGDMLASLNGILFDDLSKAELFISLFYARYDMVTRTLSYSNAGHVPPLLFRDSETSCRQLDADGMILGVEKGTIFEEKRLLMEKGDVLLLYTDGITESRNSAGELFGLSRLCNILANEHAESPHVIIDAVLREITAFAGTSVMEDDVTMIVMEVV